MFLHSRQLLGHVSNVSLYFAYIPQFDLGYSTTDGITLTQLICKLVTWLFYFVTKHDYNKLPQYYNEMNPRDTTVNSEGLSRSIVFLCHTIVIDLYHLLNVKI